MQPWQRRTFIAIDEWLWIALCLYLHRVGDPLFLHVLVAGIVLIYLVSYPLYWTAAKKDA
jgi:hypothetical protein